MRMPTLRFTSFAFAASALIAAGCAAPTEITRERTDETAEFLARYEKMFRPSDYDVEVPEIVGNKKEEEAPDDHSVPEPTVGELEVISGFRIQVAFTEDMEFAHALRDSLTEQIEKEWVYVVYEAPYYKVRVGDFPTRPHANSLLHSLNRLGYKDAWIVPDRVYKDRPPRPAERLMHDEEKDDIPEY